MHFTEEAKSTLRYLLTLNLPASTYADVSAGGIADAQCATQAEVRALRAAFGAGVAWAKAYNAECKWWTYSATLPNGIFVYIYACKEAPPTCRPIVEEIEVEEKVPVEWSTKKVKREVVKWDCGSGKEAQSG